MSEPHRSSAHWMDGGYPTYYVHQMNTLYSYRIRHLNSHSYGLSLLPFKGEPGKGLNFTFLEEFNQALDGATGPPHSHPPPPPHMCFRRPQPLYSPGCGCLRACWALQDVFRGCMTKVRRLAEGLQMPSHSPGCVEGAQWCFDTIFAPENGAYTNVC